jgi:hypothetical protein
LKVESVVCGGGGDFFFIISTKIQKRKRRNVKRERVLVGTKGEVGGKTIFHPNNVEKMKGDPSVGSDNPEVKRTHVHVRMPRLILL